MKFEQGTNEEEVAKDVQESNAPSEAAVKKIEDIGNDPVTTEGSAEEKGEEVTSSTKQVNEGVHNIIAPFPSEKEVELGQDITKLKNKVDELKKEKTILVYERNPKEFENKLKSEIDAYKIDGQSYNSENFAMDLDKITQMRAQYSDISKIMDFLDTVEDAMKKHLINTEPVLISVEPVSESDFELSAEKELRLKVIDETIKQTEEKIKKVEYTIQNLPSGIPDGVRY